MRKSLSLFLLFFLVLSASCSSNEDDNQTTITSFSGTVVFENMEPVTNAELSIAGSESTITGGVAREGAILSIDDGTFEVVLETNEVVTRYSILVFLAGDVFTFAQGLQCLPGNCRDFPPGEDYELTIVLPCTMDDCQTTQSN